MDWPVRRGQCVGLGLLSMIAAGCQPPPMPFAAESNLVAGSADEGARLILTSAEMAEADASLRSIAAGHSIVDPPRPAPGGLRWTDVPDAVDDACDLLGMAVYHVIEQDNRFVFDIRTTDERPVELIVTRQENERVYDAQATIGWFEDDHTMERSLLEKLDAAMRAQGRKPKYDDHRR